MDSKDAAKQDRRLIEQVLTKAGATNVHKKHIKCPFHEDKSPSAEIRQAASGNWNFYCYVCSIAEDYFALRERVEGTSVGEILKEEFSENKERPAYRPNLAAVKPKVDEKPKVSFPTFEDAVKSIESWDGNMIEEKNEYTDPETGLFEYATIRFRPKNGKKQIRPVLLRDGRWYFEHPKVLPLFNRKRIAKADSVLLVEGEKCVRCFHRDLEFEEDVLAATTCPRGSDGPSYTDLSPLAGKAVYLWRDNDLPGEKWESILIDKLMLLDPPCHILRVKVSELEILEKGDLVDFLEDYPISKSEKTDLVRELLQASEHMSASAPIFKYFEDVRAGNIRSIAFPGMRTLTHLSKALTPGTVTLLMGDPNAGKSFLLMDWFIRWTLEDEMRVRILMLEETPEFYQLRALAQLSQMPEITDLDVHENDPDRFEAVLDAHKDDLESVARNIVVWGGEPRTYADIAEWVETQASAGYEVIGVDPVTAAVQKGQPWIEDSKFIFKIKGIAEKTKTRIILATHTRGGKATTPLLGAAGGLAYPRFSQSVLHLRRTDDQEEAMVSVPGGIEMPMSFDRSIYIAKARSGIPGKRIAYEWNGAKKLAFSELGLISPKK